MHPVPLLTPGVARIQLSTAARVLSVSDGKTEGAITQRDPSEAASALVALYRRAAWPRLMWNTVVPVMFSCLSPLLH